MRSGPAVQRRTLWFTLGILALLAAGSYAVVEVVQLMGDWKKRAQSTAGQNLYAQLMAWFAATEDKYGIPRDLLARQGYQESHFRPDIINGSTASSAGAQGIMQIVPAYHPTAQPLNPQAAIDYAGSFMRQLYNQFGSWSLALAGYNAGAGNVSKYGGVPPFAETQAYVTGIIGDVNAEYSAAGNGIMLA